MRTYLGRRLSENEHLEKDRDDEAVAVAASIAAGARATLAAHEAVVDQLKRDIAEGEQQASSDGVIDKRILEVGDMASPQKTVFALALTDPLWVRVWLPETRLGRVPVGARATVHTATAPRQSLSRMDRPRIARRRIHPEVRGDGRSGHARDGEDPARPGAAAGRAALPMTVRRRRPVAAWQGMYGSGFIVQEGAVTGGDKPDSGSLP
jgi:multidrug efflux pump subunit AcrA (membrane-fusion protein)